MNMSKLAKELDGMYTVEMLQKQLGISRKTAINYIAMLRKEEYVHTARGKGKKRLYTISPIKMRIGGNPGLYELINKYSTIKIAPPYKTVLHGKKLLIEGAIVEAVKTGDYRIIIAVIPLFNYINNWPLLLKSAKENNVCSKIGALYELARTIIKVRRIDRRTENALLKNRRRAYLIEGIKKEKDFKNIGKRWNVVIGLTKQDLERLKE